MFPVPKGKRLQPANALCGAGRSLPDTKGLRALHSFFEGTPCSDLNASWVRKRTGVRIIHGRDVKRSITCALVVALLHCLWRGEMVVKLA